MKKRSGWKIIFVLSIIGCLCCAGFFGWYVYQTYQVQKEYQELQEEMNASKETAAEPAEEQPTLEEIENAEFNGYVFRIQKLIIRLPKERGMTLSI